MATRPTQVDVKDPVKLTRVLQDHYDTMGVVSGAVVAQNAQITLLQTQVKALIAQLAALNP